MAAALDLETTIYTQIWTVLNNDLDWANLVVPANQIRYDQVEGIQEGSKQTTADSDYPQAELWLRSGMSGLFTDSETFGTYASDGPGEWLEKHQYVFRLRLKSQLLGISEPDTLGALARRAIRKAGPRLGLSYITGIRLQWETQQNDRDENDRKMRWVTALDIFIRVEIEGEQLTT